MNDQALDNVYTQFCKTMTGLGQSNGELFLARFAMLSMVQIADAAIVLKLIEDAAVGMDAA